MTAGTRPVLVLTRQPRLILEPAVLIGHDQTDLGPLWNLLADMDAEVLSDLEDFHTAGGTPALER